MARLKSRLVRIGYGLAILAALASASAANPKWK
jgi:hypothetical protein